MTYKFYQTLSFEDSIDHPQSGYDINDPYSYRCWYEEDIQDRDDLLIMVGDSWTWGDHLGSINWNSNVNDPTRSQQIVGRVLADKLKTDWVNLARPGCSNYWMIEKLQDIVPALNDAKLKYKRIFIIVTLTEDLREATYSRRIQVENCYKQMFLESVSLKDFLMKVESLLLRNLEEYAQQIPFAKIYVSRAFTDFWHNNHSDIMLGKTWCDVLQEQVKFEWYFKPVPFLGQMAIDPLVKKFIPLLGGTLREENYKAEFLELMENVGRRWNFLGASKYNLKGSTYHPNPAGHELWAEYLYHQLDK